MSSTQNLMYTPLEDLDYRFTHYLDMKKAQLAKRMGGNGLPNYAYKMDYEYRKRLDAVPGLVSFAKKLCATTVPQQLHTYNMSGIAVGPDQFPEIYKMVRECADVLGIGIPNVLVVPGIQIGDQMVDFNAVTYAVDDVEPLIVITGLMVERMDPAELKAIIAHECGHIHNQHGLYTILRNMITTLGTNGILSIPGLRQFATLLTASTQLLLEMWSRAAEISADRAALICSGDAKVASHALSRLMYNGARVERTVASELNYEALREQMELTLSSPYRFNELMHSHPLSIKRVFAVMDFAECELMYQWRPDLKTPDQKLFSKEETDRKCKRYIDVVQPKGAKK